MYCPECGTRIDDAAARFCPECGTPLDIGEVAAEAAEAEASASEAIVAEEPVVAEELVAEETFADVAATQPKESEWVKGIILTNCRLLEQHFGTASGEMEKLLRSYCEMRRQSGVDYHLIDVDNYTYAKRGFFSRSRQVSLDPNSPLSDYMELLTDAVDQLTTKQEKGAPLFLFIIGSNDIIPMPCVAHPVKGMSDNDIDTDLLWAYPYGKEMIHQLESLSIFHYDQQLMVGRLPIGKDTTVEQFTDYLQRGINHSFGIPTGEAYGQCDPHWRLISSAVSSGIAPLMRNLSGQIHQGAYYRGLILSPLIKVEDLPQVFHPSAYLYYFNLHGSNAPESAGYFGSTMEQRPRFYTVMHPLFMQHCQEPNVVVCEACYGARHRGMDHEHSTLLSALYTQTMNFVGSSRIAWGDADSQDGRPPSPMFADTLAGTFINALQEGYPVGFAFFLAKSAVMQQDSDCTPYTAATLLEFNLFGDPSLFIELSEQVEEGYKAASKQMRSTPMKQATLPTEKSYACQMEPLGGSSLLQQVRSLVDANIRTIHEQVSTHLYQRFGISPRPVDSAFRVRYANQTEELLFNYAEETMGGEKQIYTVATDSAGKVKRVMVTK